MRALHRSTGCGLLLLIVLAFGSTLAAQDAGSTADQPFVFLTPGLAIMDRDTDHDQVFNSIDATLVMPFTPHTSAMATYSLQFNDKPRWTAAGNYDYFLSRNTTLRVAGGLFGDELGARLTAFQQRKRFGTGVRCGVVHGGLEVGGFVSLPLAWGFPLRKQSLGARVRGRNRVTDMGAATAISMSIRGGEPELGTEPEYFYPRDAEWRRFGQGPQGLSATTAGLSSHLQQAWVSETSDAVRSSAAIAENTVYVGSDDGYLYALDLETGELRWRYRIGSPVSSSPAVASGKVFVGCDDGSVYCFRVEADKRLSEERVGRQVWRFRTGDAVVGSPLVTASGRAIFGSRDGSLYAIDGKSARPVWTHSTGGPIVASPVKSGVPLAVISADGAKPVQRDVIFCASEDGHVYALAEGDGRLLWRVHTGAPIRSTPAVSGKKVIVANQDGRVVALNGRSGREEWSQTVAGAPGGSLAIAYKRVIVPLRSGRLVGLNVSTGEPEWAAEVPGRIDSTPVAVQASMVYVGSVDGHLYALDHSSGEIKWSFLTGGPISASPAVAHGRLVCGSHDGSIYGFAGKMPPEGVITQTVAPEQRMVSAKLDAEAPPYKPEPVPTLAPIRQPWTPPLTSLDAAPSKTADSGRDVIPVPKPTARVSPIGTGKLRMRLISEPADAAELPIHLTNQRNTLVAWGTTAPVAEVDGEVLHNRGGRIEAVKFFAGDGTYPVTMVTDKGTSDERIACRLVIVDTGPEPAAGRAVAFSPDGDGLGDTIAFRILGESPAGGVVARVIDIRDPAGHAVRTWSAPGPGETTFIWDGKDLAGDRVPSGIYEVIYTAKDDAGNARRMKQRVILQRAGERLVVR